MDISKLKKGSIVKFTATVVDKEVCSSNPFGVRLEGGKDYTAISKEEMEHAELVSEPHVEFTKEQAEAIESVFPRTILTNNGLRVVMDSTKEFFAWLDSHMAKEE